MARTSPRSAAPSSTLDPDERARYVEAAGALPLLAGSIALMGIITVETFYPGYNAGAQEISDLGASRPPNSDIVQPAATIFNWTMILTGLGVLAATVMLYRSFGDLGFLAPVVLFGVGVLGVGVFDGSEAPMHGIFALLTFVTGGISGLVTFRVTAAPFAYLAAGLGVISLLALASAIGLGGANPLLVMGPGGVERWVAYPILLWLIGPGGYLLGRVWPPEPA